MKKNPELLDYLPGMSLGSLDDVLQFLEQRRRDPVSRLAPSYTQSSDADGSGPQ